MATGAFEWTFTVWSSSRGELLSIYLLSLLTSIPIYSRLYTSIHTHTNPQRIERWHFWPRCLPKSFSLSFTSPIWLSLRTSFLLWFHCGVTWWISQSSLLSQLTTRCVDFHLAQPLTQQPPHPVIGFDISCQIASDQCSIILFWHSGSLTLEANYVQHCLHKFCKVYLFAIFVCAELCFRSVSVRVLA